MVVHTQLLPVSRTGSESSISSSLSVSRIGSASSLSSWLSVSRAGSDSAISLPEISSPAISSIAISSTDSWQTIATRRRTATKEIYIKLLERLAPFFISQCTVGNQLYTSALWAIRCTPVHYGRAGNFLGRFYCLHVANTLMYPLTADIPTNR